MTTCCSGSLRIALVLLLSGASVSWVDQAMSDEHAAHRAATQKTRYTVSDVRYDIPDVQLIDASSSSVSLQSILDSEQSVALNFIFTTCTTICPVMTATFAKL